MRVVCLFVLLFSFAYADTKVKLPHTTYQYGDNDLWFMSNPAQKDERQSFYWTKYGHYYSDGVSYKVHRGDICDDKGRLRILSSYITRPAGMTDKEICDSQFDD